MSKLSDALKGTKSRAEAEQVIADANPTKADLQRAAADLGYSTRTSDSKTSLTDRVVNGTGGLHDTYPALIRKFDK